jgi:hypothetical protein
MNFFRLSLNLLRRDWRAGEWRVLLIALVLAVGSIATVGLFARINGARSCITTFSCLRNMVKGARNTFHLHPRFQFVWSDNGLCSN